MSDPAQKYIRGSSAVEIAGRVERAIAEGRLEAGAALPTVRAAAGALGLSPATVAAAYRLLRDRGLVVTRGRRGTQVSPRPPLRTRQAVALPSGVRNLADGNPERDLLPDLRPALARVDPAHHLYGEEICDRTLVRLARAQLAADGIPAEHLTVVSGALDGLERVLSAHLRPGDRVAVEDPAFVSVLDLLPAHGLVAEPVPVDESGLEPAALARALSAGVSAVIVTPRAQNPSGAALDPARVRALRRVLREHPDVLVFEDDHAGPVAGAPAHTLCDAGRKSWAVVRSVSKSLGPDLRVALLTGDATTIARVEGGTLIGMRWVSHLLQRLVVELWRDPANRRVLRRAEQAYTARRSALISALAHHGIRAQGRSGLNVWVPVQEEAPVVSRLLDAGWAVTPGERFRIESPPAVRICTASLAEAEAPVLAQALAKILTPAARTYLA